MGAREILKALLCATVALAAAAPALAQPSPQSPAVGVAPAAERSTETSTLTFANRDIITLRARVLGRQPSERTAGAQQILDSLVDQGIDGPVELRDFAQGSAVMVGGRGTFFIVQADVDELAGETLESVRTRAVAHLRQAMAEEKEARSPRLLLRNGSVALLAILFASLVLWGLAIVHRWASTKLIAAAEERLTRSGVAAAQDLRESRLVEIERGVIRLATSLIALVIVYSTLTFILRHFPYTRPWGESMTGLLLVAAENLGLGILEAIPGLLTVALIFILTRVVVRIVAVWFNAVEAGRVRARFIHPETAQPTRRLATALLWVFALIVAYPYLPGSGTDAFKGVSVFLGLMLTLGSSGLVNQVVSGFNLTYSRALRLGDFVKVGEVEGTVTHIGVLSTKIRTVLSEEVTIPNAVVVSTTATNYSRLHEQDGVMTPISVTIGYDAPWRQVQALLLQAAARSPGIRRRPAPVVLQTGLEDFYVRYTLWVALERQDARPFTLHTLHANIQDLFNEYGVQIMSPNYMLDPSAPKVVPRARWYAAPASAKIEPTTPAEQAPAKPEPV